MFQEFLKKDILFIIDYSLIHCSLSATNRSYNLGGPFILYCCERYYVR